MYAYNKLCHHIIYITIIKGIKLMYLVQKRSEILIKTIITVKVVFKNQKLTAKACREMYAVDCNKI